MLPENLFNPDQWTLLNVGSILIALIMLTLGILNYLRNRNQDRQKETLNSDPDIHLFTRDDINSITKNYVQPTCSMTDPAFATTNNHSEKGKELFATINRFLAEPARDRYMLILADSGMGKTSFVLNYFAYYKKHRPIGNISLVIVPLGHLQAETTIQQITEKREKVIFLDALDEDTKAIGEIKERIEELLQLCIEFHKVIITCRSQFFPSDTEIPDTTGIKRHDSRKAGESGTFLLNRCYLLPFSNAQIRQFLKKRYSIWQIFHRNKAQKLIDTIPKLGIRPMLLAYIPDLVDEKKTIKYAFEIYEIMVARWLERESAWVNPKALLFHSEDLAIDFFTYRQSRGGAFLPAEQAKLLKRTFALDEVLEKHQVTGRSLLNRDEDGNYKFAHFSIMEYLIVKRLFQGDMKCNDLQWTDQMKEFIWEKIHWFCEQQLQIPIPLHHVDLSARQLKLRSTAASGLDIEHVEQMLRQLNFTDIHLNPRSGNHLTHLYQYYALADDEAVMDYATCLMWQQAGSTETLEWKETGRFVSESNSFAFCGFSDWRLPTLEEAASLIEFEKRSEIHIHHLFDRKLRRIWTADSTSASKQWVAHYNFGNLDAEGPEYKAFIKLVRTARK